MHVNQWFLKIWDKRVTYKKKEKKKNPFCRQYLDLRKGVNLNALGGQEGNGNVRSCWCTVMGDQI